MCWFCTMTNVHSEEFYFTTCKSLHLRWHKNVFSLLFKMKQIRHWYPVMDCFRTLRERDLLTQVGVMKACRSRVNLRISVWRPSVPPQRSVLNHRELPVLFLAKSSSSFVYISLKPPCWMPSDGICVLEVVVQFLPAEISSLLPSVLRSVPCRELCLKKFIRRPSSSLSTAEDY